MQVPSVTFPGGITIKSDDSTTNLCSTCHTGRESKATIDAQIAANKLGFRNVHYLPAGASAMGNEAQVGYEYPDGQTYAGPWTRGTPVATAATAATSRAVHDHSFDVNDVLKDCQMCHTSATKVADIRGMNHAGDYDGDGSNTEPLAGEIKGLAEALLARMQAVAVAAGGTGICYDSGTYPYFFIDTERQWRVRRRGGDDQRQRLQGLDAGAHEGRPQLPDLTKGSGRLGAQLRLHRAAPLRQRGRSRR